MGVVVRPKTGQKVVLACCLLWGASNALRAGEERPSPAPAPADTAWVFRVPTRPAAPLLKRRERFHNPIDAFLLAKLEEKGLTFALEADRATLIRRLSFDLAGLPPTPEETEAFVNDRSP